MLTEAAVCWGLHQDWSVETIELDPPRAGEVLVELAAAGVCHSDEHRVTGDLLGAYPVVGGHEGAGVVVGTGPGVTRVRPGDHVVFGFMPACGVCPSCAQGQSNLCDMGAVLVQGLQADGTARHHARGEDLRTMICLGTFARHTVVNEVSCVKILDDVPLDLACLVGCGVTTGWGSAVYAAGVRAGDNVTVLGAGGVGAAAIQGARMAGAARIFVVDPVERKRELARSFGATSTFASLDDAVEPIRDETWGTMCQQVICAVGVGHGDQMAQIMSIVAKGGRCVVTNIHPRAEWDVRLSLCDLTLMEKQIVGTIYGSANIHHDIPHLLKLHRFGQLDLAGMVTSTYQLGDVNQAFADLRAGRNIRGVLVYDD